MRIVEEKGMNNGTNITISKFAYATGQVVGMLSREDVKEYLVNNNITDFEIVKLDEILMKIAEVFYKNKV